MFAVQCSVHHRKRVLLDSNFAPDQSGALQQMKKANACSPLMVLAEWTGLEPATPGVTGRYSNQLNYHSLILHVKFRWWVLRGSNPRHSPCKGDALPTELSTRCADPNCFCRLHVLVPYFPLIRCRMRLNKAR